MFAHTRAVAAVLAVSILAGCGGKVSAPRVEPSAGLSPTTAPAPIRESAVALGASGPAIVASFTMGLARTTDEGDTWSVVSRMPAYGFAGDGSALFAATPRGVMRSLDHGASWKFVNVGLPEGRGAWSVVMRGGVLFAGVVISPGVYRSTDLGESWARFDLPGGTSALSLVAREQDLFVNALDRRVYRSTDDGLSWAPADAGLPPERRMRLAAIGDRLFAGVWVPGGVYVSTDDGATWERSDGGLPDGRGIAALTAGPTGTYACTGNGLYRSVDGGASWSQLAEGWPPGSPASAFVESDGVLFMGTSGDGVFRSRDDGASWKHLGPTGIPPEPPVYPALP